MEDCGCSFNHVSELHREYSGSQIDVAPLAWCFGAWRVCILQLRSTELPLFEESLADVEERLRGRLACPRILSDRIVPRMEIRNTLVRASVSGNRFSAQEDQCYDGIVVELCKDF